MKKRNLMQGILAKLPKKAQVLGSKFNRSNGKTSFEIIYISRGITFSRSFSMEGGEV